MIKVTVIVCTFNRSESLAKSLQSVAASTVPGSVEWEVLVVDNNSTDRTREAVEDLSRQYPGRFRYLFEPKSGLSHARNAGIREAQGDILAFTDDDVTVDATWLQNLTACLHGTDWAGAGGRTLLPEPFSPPSWLGLQESLEMGGPLAALFDIGLEPCELKRPPYGANMAFRKNMFEKYGAFRTDLGASPGPDVPRCNEDTEFGRRLIAGGERLRYEPSAIVYHPVPGERVRKDYFLAWWFDYGRALIREKGESAPLWGISRHYFSIPKMIGVCVLPRALKWLSTVDPMERFARKCWTWLMAGEIVETYRLARDRRRHEASTVREQG
jgi:glycosyltransferase involved in cell wall biosynthesis